MRCFEIVSYHRELGDELPGKYGVVAARTAAGERILEIGCHTGYFLSALRRKGRIVSGLERDPEAAAVAKSAGLDVVIGDADDPAVLAKLPGPFDAVIMMDVLEHMSEPERTLRALRTAVSPRGRLLVTGPNVAYWAVRRNLLLGRWDYVEGGIMDRTHVKFYTAKTWRELLRRAGWRVVNWHGADAMFPGQGLLRRLPIIGRCNERIAAMLMRAMPTLFSIVLFFEAVPDGNSHDA